jgi:hypothetical protein
MHAPRSDVPGNGSENGHAVATPTNQRDTFIGKGHAKPIKAVMQPPPLRSTHLAVAGPHIVEDIHRNDRTFCCGSMQRGLVA